MEPPDAIVSVNGKEYGPASKWAQDEMLFRDMAVYQVGLAAPGYEPKTIRLLVAPTAGELRATIKEKLKKAVRGKREYFSAIGGRIRGRRRERIFAGCPESRAFGRSAARAARP